MIGNTIFLVKCLPFFVYFKPLFGRLIMTSKTNEKIKQLRESKKLTQSQMAEKLHISTNTYGRLERGETELTERRLEQIAEILEITDFTKILSTPSDKIIFLLNEVDVLENQEVNIGCYHADTKLKIDNEKLTLLLEEQKKLLAAKDEQIRLLQELLQTLKQYK